MGWKLEFVKRDACSERRCIGEKDTSELSRHRFRVGRAFEVNGYTIRVIFGIRVSDCTRSGAISGVRQGEENSDNGDNEFARRRCASAPSPGDDARSVAGR